MLAADRQRQAQIRREPAAEAGKADVIAGKKFGEERGAPWALRYKRR
jgi:hypothetical protein